MGPISVGRAALRVVWALVLSKISGPLYVLHPTNPTAFRFKLALNTYNTNCTLKHTTETKYLTWIGFLRDFIFANSSIISLKSSLRNISCSMLIRVSMTRRSWPMVGRNWFLIRASFEKAGSNKSFLHLSSSY